MVSFLITVLRFVRAFGTGLKDSEFRAMAITAVIMVVSGMVFYSSVEGWGLIDSLYFCVITLTTIGYGDMHPTSPLSKLFTVFYVLVGIGVLVAFINKLATEAVRRRLRDDQGHKFGKE